MSNFPRAVALALAAPIAYSFFEPHRLRVSEFDVELENLPPEAEGLRVVHLSDLHVSAISSDKFLRRIVAQTNKLDADIIVLTGDYVSRRNSYLPLSGARIWAKDILHYARRMADELKGLKARDGIFACLGNHDVADDNGAAIFSLLREANIVVLHNDQAVARGIAICGLDDLRAGRPDFDRTLRGVSVEEPQIILSHNPRVFPFVQNRNALVLAGHTHGGQVHLPLTNYRRRPSDMKKSPYFQGWYRSERAQMYISSGLGSVHFPMRFRCAPEIAVFTLRRI